MYDPETNTLNLANKKATDMRSNQRVKLVDHDIDDKKEMKRDVLKVEIVNTYQKNNDRILEVHCACMCWLNRVLSVFPRFHLWVTQLVFKEVNSGAVDGFFIELFYSVFVV